jgi:dipeptidyl aminopeptidase/acylaminoacyl peptidase
MIAVHLLTAAAALGDEEKEAESRKAMKRIETWLMLGPVTLPFPAFNEEGGDKLKAKDLLGSGPVRLTDVRPLDGARVSSIGGDAAFWRVIEADTSGVGIDADRTLPSVAYLAAYIDVPRWMKIDIEARSTDLFEVTIDGVSAVKQEERGSMEADGVKTGSAKLGKGKHLLIVKALFVPGDTLTRWVQDVALSAAKDYQSEPLLSIDPMRPMHITDILDIPVMRGVDVSPDGTIFALTMSRRTPPEGKSENWLEIRRVEDGTLLETLADVTGASNWQWAPSGHRLSYMVAEEGAGTLRVLDLDGGGVVTIVKDVKDLSGYDWSPDGGFVTYSVKSPAEEDESGVKRLRGVYDRRHYERDKTSLYVSSVPSAMTRRLTAGKYSTRTYDVHPNGRSILIGRSYEDLSNKPYEVSELIVVHLDDQRTEVLWKGPWLRNAIWSPRGEKILVTGGPSSFGTSGQNVPAGVTPNDYDVQAYLFDPKTKQADPITRNFHPTVRSLYWPRPGDDIYVLAEEGEYEKLYRYNIKKRSFKNIDLGFDVAHALDVAQNKAVAVMVGSGANAPWRLYSVDLKRGKVRELLYPSSERYGHVTLGKVQSWDFTSGAGRRIVGRIHYPPNFDATRKWPCIVYYYGGTSPVTRSFGGRYPKNLWAANGYVVYVLQPSGATGFGQEFSALHVNDWGKIVSDEIIEGTRMFLKAHDFVDPDRVGCIGASFGGFMTQLILAKTDIYAGGVSHAGISSISSYWGEGYWGYGYNSVSAANSFPWNRPDIYVDQSPLSSADKINTPLLLLHGAADTNVPPGESDQMYAALKILGKEVEYIRFAGQNHFILDYKKRIEWSNAILAWFDRWLKDEPEWWHDTYPPIDENLSD